MLTARQLMRQPLHTISARDSVALAIRRMQLNHISSLIVPPRDENGEYGILTKHDILNKVVAADRNPVQVRVGEVMTSPLVSVDLDCSARRCAALMMQNHIRRLPVVQNGQPIGIVSDSDVFDALLNFHTEAALYPSV